MQAIKLQHYSIVSALGRGKTAQLDALLQQRTGLTPCNYPGAEVNSYIGQVAEIDIDKAPP